MQFTLKPETEERLKTLAERVEAFRADGELAEEAVRRLQADFRIRSVYHSNAIEGSTLTLNETKVLLEQGVTVGNKPLQYYNDAKNLALGTDYVEALAKGEEPITEATVRALNNYVLEGKEGAGAYREVGVAIAGVDHRPPPPVEVPPLMEELFEWYRENERDDPLLVASVVHWRLVYIHPFWRDEGEGNGRTARLLANLILIRRGYPRIILDVGRRPQYYEALQAADDGNIDPFVNFQADAADEAMGRYESFAARKRP